MKQVLTDWKTAPIAEPLRAALGYLEKLTMRPGEVTKDDARAVLAAGVSRQALEDAIAVCAAFCMIDRIADAVNFYVGDQAAFDAGAKALLRFGYSL